MKKVFFVSALLCSTALGQDMSKPFLITAPLNTEVKLSTLSAIKINVTDIQVNAAPGTSASKEELAKIKQDLSNSLEQANQTITTKGKMSQKVIKTDKSGLTTLKIDLNQEMPDTAAIKFSILQQIDKQGKIKNVKISSDDPQLSKMFKKMNVKDIDAFVDSAGANLNNFYGIQYTKDKAVEHKLTIDAQSMLGDMVSSISGQQAMKMNPMKVTTSSIYRGLDSNGLHKFDLKTTFDDKWTFNIPSQQTNQPAMNAELINAETSGYSLHYKNGLMAGSDQEMKMRMKMTMIDKKYKISMVMNIINQSKQMSEQSTDTK